MIELFKNPQIDWVKLRKPFLFLSIILLVIGAIAVQVRGFALGVDFTGGTLLTVKFSEQTSTDDVRDALSQAGIDTSKMVVQNVVGRSNEFLVRAPQSGNEFQDRRRIIGALQGLHGSGGVNSADKLNINVVSAEGIDQELRQADPLGIANQTFAGAHPYRSIGDQVIGFRDSAQRGFISDINALQTVSFTVSNLPSLDQAAIKAVLIERFAAAKIDLNLVGASEIEDALNRINPLGSGSAETYKKAAEAIKAYRSGRDGVIRNVSEIQHADVSAELLQKMEPYFLTGGFAVLAADVVGPQVGAELTQRAIYVTLTAMAGMLLYIVFRFEWISGVAGIVGIFHDVLITLGIFSLIQKEIDLTVVAALLTLVGYTMNDKIVIFDRLRENLRLRRRDNLVQITNDSINQTLSRTIITGGLTFVSTLALAIFGGEVLRGFALALTLGILVGTYSSIAVASPMMLWWHHFVAARSKRGVSQAAGASATKRPLANV
ncbi:MAG TPA: protein translocase subunit SecF [Blastocatellia bacterium]|jgi:preprotein translocase subunit SecF|nr:protein translocase subunit SecF [Blastocatellia bacterium]